MPRNPDKIGKFVPLRTVLRELAVKHPGLPQIAVLAAARRGDFPTRRSGNGPKARRYVDPAVLKEYIAKLGWK